MEKSNGFGSGHMLLAVLGGAAAGAAAALLMAPKSGKETREQFAGYLENAQEKVSRVPDALMSAGHAAREVMSEELEEHKPGSAKKHARS